MASRCCRLTELQIKHFGFTDTPRESFYVSKWSENRATFLIYRAALFIYWFSMTLYSASENVRVEGGYSYFIYLSSWGEWMIVVNFGLALGVAVYGSCSKYAASDTGSLPRLHKAYWMMRSASAATAYMITMIFWSVLRVTSVSLLVNIHRHALNSVLITLDIFVGKVPVRLLHVIYVIGFGFTYILFTLFLHLAGAHSTFYPMILDWANSPAITVGVIIGSTFIASPVLHGLTFCFHRLSSALARKCGCGGKDIELKNSEEKGVEIDMLNGNL